MSHHFAICSSFHHLTVQMVLSLIPSHLPSYLIPFSNQSLCLLIRTGWGPHAYFKVLSESASNSQSSSAVVVTTNSLSTLPPENTMSYVSSNHQSEDRILLQRDIEVGGKR